jgi:hypothetical protein
MFFMENFPHSLIKILRGVLLNLRVCQAGSQDSHILSLSICSAFHWLSFVSGWAAFVCTTLLSLFMLLSMPGNLSPQFSRRASNPIFPLMPPLLTLAHQEHAHVRKSIVALNNTTLISLGSSSLGQWSDFPCLSNTDEISKVCVLCLAHYPLPSSANLHIS